MSRLACIIPVLGDPQGLEPTLLSVLERRPDDCEVLVVLNTQYDDPYDLAGEIEFISAPTRSGLVDCINLGIAAVKAPIVHTLGCGFEVDHDWALRALEHFEDPRVWSVTPLVYHVADRNQLLAAGVGYSPRGRRHVCETLPASTGSSLESVGPLAAAGFYRKAALRCAGNGLPGAVGDRLVDVDVALMLRAAGWKQVIEPQCRVFAAELPEHMAGGIGAGFCGERLFWRHWKEVGALSSLIAHPFALASDIADTAPHWKLPLQWLGRAVSACDFTHVRQYQAMVAEARADAAIAQEQWETRQRAAESTAARDRIERRTDAQHPLRHGRARHQSAARRVQQRRATG